VKIVDLGRAREESAAWQAECVTESGRLLPVLANAIIAMKVVMPQTFAYDQMLRAAMLVEPLRDESPFKPRPVHDVVSRDERQGLFRRR
jgi:hypothetical protein